MSPDYPIFIGKEITIDREMLRHIANNRLTGNTTSVSDVLYNKTDVTTVPELNELPNVGVVYGIRKSGDVFIGAIITETDGVISSHNEFDEEEYVQTVEERLKKEKTND